jgi:hypothetical protein
MNTEARAWFSLSQKQRRLAHEYKRFALDDEQAGKLERYRINRQRSDTLWRAAKFSFQRVRVWRYAETEARHEIRRAA